DERATAAQNLGQEMNGQLANLKTTIAYPHQDHIILSARQVRSKFKAIDSPSGSLSTVAIDLAFW
ncbi:nodulation factor ABC transporter ATP-binding protein NodI, partial [Rhizobium ruizarguesonis]